MLAALLLIACQANEEPVDPSVLIQGSCDGGDAASCYELGTQRLNAPTPDLTGARTVFSKACNIHHAPSCFELGQMVRDARGGPRDPKRALDIFGIACEGGILGACAELGVMYYDGIGTKADPARAVTLLNPACQGEKPVALACSHLGTAWAEGKGVAGVDQEVARNLHTRACDLNDPASCAALGKFLSTGVDAATAFDKACGLDAKFGCYEYAELHRDAKVPDAAPQTAAIYFQKTCSVDPTRGCYEAAEILAKGKLARKEEIQSLYNVACEHGKAEACAKRATEE